jgi:hypothetical protein
MKPISQIPYKDISINFMEEKGFIGYSFGFEGRNYGQKVPVNTRKRTELIEAIGALFINAIESYENLCKKSQ